MDRKRKLHFHIRWYEMEALDWECFSTRVDAEARAKQLVRGAETYSVEELDDEASASPQHKICIRLHCELH